MDAPPSYEAAQASTAPGKSTGTYLKARNGIPPSTRRSMEDESRPLPSGWIRQFDAKEQHQFFVDTNAKPPRSIWHHPYDDEQYLSTLSSEERERIQELHKTPSKADLAAESTDDEDDHHQKGSLFGKGSAATGGHASLPDRPPEKQSLARRMKDKMTGTTHEQREQLRRERAEQERKDYEAHMAFRQAMARAMETGQPQLFAKDKDGKDVYVEPPGGAGYTGGSYGMQPSGYGYNPYSQGPYANANARFIRPDYAYSRPYGMGYGGGMGMPLMGGMMGGMMLGGLLF